MEATVNWLEHKPQEFEYNGKWIKNWFSNLVMAPINVDGTVWPSVENYYQAHKSINVDTIEQIRNLTPSKAKQMGKKVFIRPNWDLLKEHVMRKALEAKFAQRDWNKLLMATGDSPIIEWNNWGDRYWGVTEDGTGKNRLGILLMEIRGKYKKDPLK